MEDPRSDVSASKPMVLVAEDDHDTQAYMRILLGKEFDVLVASSGDEVRIQLFSHSGHVRIILMDLSLRGPEDGLMITRDLRRDEQFKTLPIIAVTAHASREDRVNRLAAGCDDYVMKPFEPRELLSTMRKFL